MYESSGPQFSRTTTGIQSGPDTFNKSRLVMTFLTILGVTEIFCIFRLVQYPEKFAFSMINILELFSNEVCTFL